MKNKKIIYLDNASATPLAKEVKKEMMKNLNNFSNSSSIHELGVIVREKINNDRKKIATFLNCHEDEIIFTSGGTESNNLALRGVVDFWLSRNKKLPHLITSEIEHPSIFNVCKYFEKQGFPITYLPVSENGFVDPMDVEKSLRPETVLVSVIYASNEIGTIQPIQEIAKKIRHFKKKHNRWGINCYPYFHSDACQATNYLSMTVEKLGIDLLSFNASKIYGPKGIGILFKKRNLNINPLFYGGHQEFGLRAGTESNFLISGFSKAIELVTKNKIKEIERLKKLQSYFFKKLLGFNKRIDNNFLGKIIINGGLENRLPNNINIGIYGIDSDILVLELSDKGVYVSSRSACQNEDNDFLYFLKNREKYGIIRFTLGRETKKEDLIYTIFLLKKIIAKYSFLEKNKNNLL